MGKINLSNIMPKSYDEAYSSADDAVFTAVVSEEEDAVYALQGKSMINAIELLRLKNELKEQANLLTGIYEERPDPKEFKDRFEKFIKLFSRGEKEQIYSNIFDALFLIIKEYKEGISERRERKYGEILGPVDISSFNKAISVLRPSAEDIDTAVTFARSLSNKKQITDSDYAMLLLDTLNNTDNVPFDLNDKGNLNSSEINWIMTSLLYAYFSTPVRDNANTFRDYVKLYLDDDFFSPKAYEKILDLADECENIVFDEA